MVNLQPVQPEVLERPSGDLSSRLCRHASTRNAFVVQYVTLGLTELEIHETDGSSISMNWTRASDSLWQDSRVARGP